MFTNLIDKIKKTDLITVFIITLIIITSISFLTKFFEKSTKSDFDFSNKKIGTFAISKICYDINGVTECIEINRNVYRLVLINETATNEIPTLYIKK